MEAGTTSIVGEWLGAQGDFEGVDFYFQQGGACSYYYNSVCTTGTWSISAGNVTVIFNGTCPMSAGTTLVVPAPSSTVEWVWTTQSGTTCNPLPPTSVFQLATPNNPSGPCQ
jgi:hypothetical protein